MPVRSTSSPAVARGGRVPFNARFSNWLSRVLVRLKLDEVPHIKRIIVTVVGGTIVILGVLMFFTPGPAILVIPAGLAVLGTEYAWARRWLRNARAMAKKALSRTQRIFSTSNGRSSQAGALSPSTPAGREAYETEELRS
jgi:hypothetical protein